MLSVCARSIKQQKITNKLYSHKIFKFNLDINSETKQALNTCWDIIYFRFSSLSCIFNSDLVLVIRG